MRAIRGKWLPAFVAVALVPLTGVATALAAGGGSPSHAHPDHPADQAVDRSASRGCAGATRRRDHARQAHDRSDGAARGSHWTDGATGRANRTSWTQRAPLSDGVAERATGCNRSPTGPKGCYRPMGSHRAKRATECDGADWSPRSRQGMGSNRTDRPRWPSTPPPLPQARQVGARAALNGRGSRGIRSLLRA